MGKDNMHKHKLSHIEDLSKQIKLTATWEDLNLSQATITRLREICSQFKHNKSMSRESGFGKNLVGGNGLIAIFSGPSATGKTLAAEIISKELATKWKRVSRQARPNLEQNLFISFLLLRNGYNNELMNQAT
ncbi:unnamed protein product [marine sediment metagenome]|uniref:ATPase AAA-type core domain-containing protein n=1 Tax=marine sediment metagenome TaxID=412755 RepID=X1RHN4_9ZZZZ